MAQNCFLFSMTGLGQHTGTQYKNEVLDANHIAAVDKSARNLWDMRD
jgi:hypothetical protein